MATTLLRQRPADFAAVVGLSGFVVDAGGDPCFRDAELDGHVPLFWGRDQQDPVITQDKIEYTMGWVRKHVKLTKVLYTGMWHGINQQEIGHVSEFLTHEVLNSRKYATAAGPEVGWQPLRQQPAQSAAGADPHGLAVHGDGVAVVQLAAAAVVDFAVDLDQPVLDEFRGLHAVLHQVGELQQLAQPDHAVADGDVFNSGLLIQAIMPDLRWHQ